MLVLSRPCKVQVIHDSPGFWIPSSRFQILGTGFRITCQRNLDSGFLELKSGFQSPGVQIPGAKTSPDSRTSWFIKCLLLHPYVVDNEKICWFTVKSPEMLSYVARNFIMLNNILASLLPFAALVSSDQVLWATWLWFRAIWLRARWLSGDLTGYYSFIALVSLLIKG